MIANLYRDTGKHFGFPGTDLTAARIIEVVEALNPKFSSGETIFLFNENKQSYTEIDNMMYEDAMREVYENE